MSGLGSAREALVAEAIGEVARLVDRLEAIAPALDANRLTLVRSCDAVAARLAAFETRMAAITENAKVQAVRHIARRTDEMATSTLSAQTRAMEEAARAVLSTELGLALQRLSAPLHAPRDSWRHSVVYGLTHAATAAASSALTWAMAAMLWLR